MEVLSPCAAIANDHPGPLAIFISHDGGVTFVANRAGEVVFWEQTSRP